MFQPLVASPGKTCILRIENKFYAGKQIPKIADSAIGRVIVYDYDFNIQSPAAFLDRIEALFQKVFDIKVDYDNRQSQP